MSAPIRQDDFVQSIADALAGVRDGAGLPQLVEAELRALIAGVVHRRPQIHGIGAVSDGCSDGIEGAGRGQ